LSAHHFDRPQPAKSTLTAIGLLRSMVEQSVEVGDAHPRLAAKLGYSEAAKVGAATVRSGCNI